MSRFNKRGLESFELGRSIAISESYISIAPNPNRNFLSQKFSRNFSTITATMVSPYMIGIAETEEGYFLEQTSSASSHALLVNNSGSVSIVEKEKVQLTSSISTIAGIIGIIHLSSGAYLITANGSSEVGRVFGDKKIYRITAFSILPLSSNRSVVTEEETKYLELLKNHLNDATLFFSYDYDLTSSVQRQSQLDTLLSSPSWRTVDTEFMWNNFVSSDLIKLAEKNPIADNFILPVIYGYAKLVKTTINQKPVTFGLITRRSRYRAGTRYFRRGINTDGYVANFNETEQLLIIHSETGEDSIYSYLQIRGSVPVYWAEMNNLQYKPNLLLGPSDYIATRQHFQRTSKKYGKQYLVNLVNQKGYERPVKLAYESAVTALNDPNIDYTYFDFHHECRKMRWDRVKLLISHLKERGLSDHDYCSVTIGEKVIMGSRQTHAVRTNCMDCLDRTNVVQSTLGRWFLQSELEKAGVVSVGQSWESIDPAFNYIFQNFWADNADAVSNSYSGTGALKTDFTRTGKRTKKGALNDLINSITRYIKNNYRDGPRQDGYDIFLGNALPYEIVNSQFQDVRPAATQAIPYVLLASLTILFTTLIYPKGSLLDFKNCSFLAICVTVLGFSLRYIVKNGIQFVNWPRLCSLDYLKTREILNDGKFNGVLYEKAATFNKYVAEDQKKE